MQIFNVRLGLATNSSSSHSLIFLSNFKANDFQTEGNDFGWGHFTAASENAKTDYLGILLRDRLLRCGLPKDIAAAVMRDWLRRDNVVVSDAIEDGYIDHQSWMYLPSSPGSELPDGQFFKEFLEYMKHPSLAILGGNDNDDQSHALINQGISFNMPLEYDNYRVNWVCRKDEKYNYWSIFCPTTGAKVRFSLEAGKPPVAELPKKSFAPELVDVKITDFCPFGCKYCYQSSTTAGVHCENVWSLAHALGRLKVFEVAIGGGEPTLHPDFTSILTTFREHGIVPNFTTKNIQWLHDPITRDSVLAAAGAFAVSVENRQQIQRLVETLNYYKVDKKRCNLHMVMGVIPSHELFYMLREADDNELRTTLLGYKNVGFGENITPQRYNEWLPTVLRMHADNKLGDISIDTVLAAQFEKELEASGLSPLLYHTQDGKFSCYVDWVKQTIGPSSYCDESEMKPIDYRTLNGADLADRIVDLFAAF